MNSYRQDEGFGGEMVLADAGWTVDLRKVFGRVAVMKLKEVELEMMSLAELMYYVLVGKA